MWGLQERRVDRRHILAAVLAIMVAARGTRHRVATLHGLFRRRHRKAVQSEGSKGYNGDSQQDSFDNVHLQRE